MALQSDEEYYDYIHKFSQLIEYRMVPKNEFVFHIGDQGDYFYILFKGSGDIYVAKRYMLA
jgi:CRP-like cAMP-binding protein